MQKLRFALAVLAVALASSANRALALEESCPMAIGADPPVYTCGYTGKGSCANSNCEYDCDGTKVVFAEACNET